MTVVTQYCDTCREFVATLLVGKKPWTLCSVCDEKEFNKALGYDDQTLPKIVYPSKGEA